MKPLTFTCYSKTIEGLLKHVACCEAHYGVVIDMSKIRAPMPPCICEYTVDLTIPIDTEYRCPKKNKGCE